MKDGVSLEIFKNMILLEGTAYYLKDLIDFPYKSLDEIKKSVQNNELNIKFHYDEIMFKTLASSNEIFFHSLWKVIPFIFAITNLVLVFVFSNYYFLFGVLFCILNKLVGKIALLLLIFSLIFLDWSWSFIFISILISMISSLTPQKQYEIVIKESMFNSEIIFNYLLKNDCITLHDSKNNKTYGFNNHPV